MSCKPEQNSLIQQALELIDDPDPLLEEALKLIEDPDLRSHVSKTLPNKGQDARDICARGFARFERDFEGLSDAIIEGLSGEEENDAN